jgi:hypothetical protein
VNNLNKTIKRQKLHRLPATDALIADLDARGIHNKLLINKDNRVDHLFIAYLKSNKLAGTNYDVILLIVLTRQTNTTFHCYISLVGAIINSYVCVDIYDIIVLCPPSSIDLTGPNRKPSVFRKENSQQMFQNGMEMHAD